MDDVPEGYERIWVPCGSIPSELAWEIVPPEQAKQCRWTDQRVRCDNQSAARLNRARPSERPQWWHYCVNHLYGRRIHCGHVEVRILVASSEVASDG